MISVLGSPVIGERSVRSRGEFYRAFSALRLFGYPYLGLEDSA